MRDGLENYALKILADAGCDCYTYGDEQAKHILSDLKEAFPDGMKYPYIDVANAILAISRPRPLCKAPWKMVWSNEHSCDGVECESYEEAKYAAEDTLIEWMSEMYCDWSADGPTKEQIDDWNYMVGECYTEIYKYDPDTDEYVEVDALSYEDEEKIGWREIDENYKPWVLMQGGCE